MADQAKGTITKDSVQQLQLRSLYNVAGIPFVIPEPIKRGEMKTLRGEKRDDTKLDALVLDVTVEGKTEQIEVFGKKFNYQNKKQLSINGLNFRIDYGSQILEAPFNVKLNDFQLDKYPGSQIASAYASEVTVSSKEETFDYRIFMNHILDYKGYKLYQASYSITDEGEQTQLSVNHDFWGTLLTYIGYSLLYTGLICILFAKGTRFDSLKKNFKKIKQKKAALSLFIGLFAGITSYAQEHDTHTQTRITDQQIDSILNANVVDKAHAKEFSKLVIQDAGGRMKPAHTFASELVRKVSHQEKFKGLEPSQVLISIMENQQLWFEMPFIYLEKGILKFEKC